MQKAKEQQNVQEFWLKSRRKLMRTLVALH